MPDIRDIYAEVDLLELPQLHARREAIIQAAPKLDGSSEPNYDQLGDEPLAELLAINRALRKKVAANAGNAKRASATPKAKAAKKDIGDLL